MPCWRLISSFVLTLGLGREGLTAALSVASGETMGSWSTSRDGWDSGDWGFGVVAGAAWGTGAGWAAGVMACARTLRGATARREQRRRRRFLWRRIESGTCMYI